MKKLFTLLSALLCAWSVQAQTLTFQHDGQNIENGTTFYSMEYDEIAYKYGSLTFTPKIHLVGDDTRTVYVTLEALDKTESWGLCSFNYPQLGCLNTYASSNYEAKKWGTILGGNMDLAIDYILPELVNPAQEYTYRALVSAWYEGEEDNKVSFTLVVTTDETLLSIDGVQSSKAHVSMQGNVMHYALDGEGVHTLYLYGLDGAMVMSRTLAGSEGQVSLSSLRKGIYLYQIAGKSGSKAQGKIIVK